jgi:putative ABC transport system permease protein
MIRIALRMLLGDHVKFNAMVFAIAASAFLISQQVSIFVGLMDRTTSQIRDVVDAPIWVMHPESLYVDEIKALPDADLDRVRSVEGVAWAVKLFKGYAKASAANGRFRQAILLGLDDATLVGVPRVMVMGSWESLRQPDAIVLDDQGYASLFPGEPMRLGRSVELNDRRATIVGICKPRPPFQTFPVVYTRFSQAIGYVGRERNTMSYVLAQPVAGVSVPEAIERIERRTGLMAMPTKAFAWRTIWYYIGNTGIPVNFGITVVTAIIVGVVVSGQTFYLFVVENIKHFASLKAVGADDGMLLRMVVAQASVVGSLGMAIGIGGCATFFYATSEIPKLRGFMLHGEVALGTAGLMVAITALASVVALRRVMRVEPGIVFKG